MKAVCTLMCCLIMLASGCKVKNEAANSNSTLDVSVPAFNVDSAFAFTAAQVQFGPRIPNSPAHRAAGDFIISRLRKYGAIVITQEFKQTTFDGQVLLLRNIIATFGPEKQKRILLAAHWDTRPFADKDPENKNAQLDGANDGASGVAVVLEIARQLGSHPANAGVDLILFDGEDWGERDDAKGKFGTPGGLDSWWCLGSQYWTRNMHRAGYTAYFGILLDMVGGKNARFFQEGNSVDYAPRIVEKVWSTAARLGFSSTFLQQQAGPVTDDHLFINDRTSIPMIDIIPYDPASESLGEFHHTQKDNLSGISRETMGIVGAVVMNVIYREE